MKPNIALIAAAVLLSSLPSCGSATPGKQQRAASTQDPAAAAASAPYSVSGARLTMTPEQVAPALRADGYQPDPGILSSSTGPSFEEQVQLRIGGKAPERAHEVPTIQLWRKGKETVRVWYAAYPGGSRATMFQWQTEDASPSADEIIATLTKRYGPGWRLKPFLSPQWCSPMPCSDRSAILSPGVKEVWLTEPKILGEPVSVQARLDAAVRARTGVKHGSF